ncbi:MAG TPA: hypothetical protein VFR09_05595 [Alphaproteobacteria bacterium]|nr:hypothetical protein [Alphaproteobacteria bacterium]
MEELTLADYIAIFKRRQKYFYLTFAILFTISLIGAALWSTYRSMATVEIEQPQVAPDMTTPMGMNPADTPEALADLRVSKIEQKITSPASLVEIITKLDLYHNDRKSEPMESIAKRMSDKIKLTLVSSTVANPAATQKVSVDQLSAIAFTLSFDYNNPQTAQQVMNELVTRFLDEDLKERREQAHATSEFIASQIAGLESSMAEQEKKIAEFQTEHGVARPETLMFNQQAAENATMSLQGLDSQIQTNEGTQGSLRAQLATVDPYSRVIADGQVLTTPATQLKALQAQYSTLTAQYGPMHPDVIKVKHQIESLEAQVGHKSSMDTGPLRSQIDDVQTNLEASQKTHGADDPDVVALKNKLKSLQDQLTKAEASSGSSSNGIKNDADNPAYLALVAQLRASEEQHKALITQRASLQTQQEKYQKAILQNPELEQQMASLSRDYDNAQLRYRELKEKKMAADMDEQMIQDRKGQRLAIINPPDLPLHTHPRQLLLILAGLILSVAGGVAAIVVTQALSESVSGTQHLTALVGVPPLVTIPHIYTEDERIHTRHLNPRIIAAALLLLVVAGGLVSLVLMPLEALWGAFMHLVGLS